MTDADSSLAPLRVLEGAQPDAEVKVTTSEKDDGKKTTVKIEIEVPNDYIVKRVH